MNSLIGRISSIVIGMCVTSVIGCGHLQEKSSSAAGSQHAESSSLQGLNSSEKTHHTQAKEGVTTTLKVISTTDVHGWMSPYEQRSSGLALGGSTQLAAHLKQYEGQPYRLGPTSDPTGYLLLDSGDMWTGPPESTVAKGAPMTKIFNTLGYHAAVVGNHEFDFGIDILRKRASELAFPLLAANLKRLDGGPNVDFVAPSRLVQLGGTRVGVIGLALETTPRVTMPTHVKGLEFQHYTEVVRKEGERLVGAGADLLIVVAHEELANLREMVDATADLPLRLVLGGHNHQREITVVERDPATDEDDVVMVTAGCYARAYGRIEFRLQGRAVVQHEEKIVEVSHSIGDAPRDPEIAKIVDAAIADAGPLLNEEIGRADATMEVGTVEHSPLGHLVADSWLRAFPEAEIAFANIGGIRQPIEAGTVRMRDAYGVLPFANDLVMVELTGAQIREALSGRHVIVSGLRYYYEVKNEQWMVVKVESEEGKSIENTRRYKVITTDFLYLGGDSIPFQIWDPQPELTGINWREPFISYFRATIKAGLKAPTERRAIEQPQK